MEKNHIVITISRQFCSGGQRVAKRLSEDIGIKVYDSELLAEAARESGIAKELFENLDEKPSGSFLYSLVMDASYGFVSKPYQDIPINHKIFLAQIETIRRIAGNESCVILGRCADYALGEMEECTTVFLCADDEDRISFAQGKYDLTYAQAKERIRKEDKARSSYYNFYTDKKWGKASGYDLCINTSVLGIDKTVKLIEDFVRMKHN